MDTANALPTTQSIWALLCRLNVEHNYARYISALRPKGKRGFDEGVEDHGLIGAFVVHVPKADHSDVTDWIEDDPQFVPYSAIHHGPDSIEETLVEFSKHYDGAVVLDESQRTDYVVFDGLLRKARRTYNRFFLDETRYFSKLLPKFLPSTFSVSEGGKIQAGSKSKNALAASRVIPSSTVYLLKVTAYGSVGTGKVIQIHLEKNPDSLQFQEFFLYLSEDLSNLQDAPPAPPSEQDFFDKSVVGVFRKYATRFTPSNTPKDRMKDSLAPELVESRFLSPNEIFVSRDYLRRAASTGALSAYFERKKNYVNRRRN